MSSSSSNPHALGRGVRAIRKERDINQTQLSQKSDLTSSGISRVEDGSRNPSWANVIRLAEGLGVSSSELARRAETC